MPANRKPVERDDLGRVKAGGGSLNPSGVPKKVLAIKAALEQHADGAVEKLVALMDDENARVRLSAVELVLAYAIGKPSQELQVQVGDTVNAVLAKIYAGRKTENP